MQYQRTQLARAPRRHAISRCGIKVIVDDAVGSSIAQRARHCHAAEADVVYHALDQYLLRVALNGIGVGHSFDGTRQGHRIRAMDVQYAFEAPGTRSCETVLFMSAAAYRQAASTKVTGDPIKTGLPIAAPLSECQCRLCADLAEPNHGLQAS